MTHHSPLCEELACDFCTEPDCADREMPYGGPEPEASPIDIIVYELSEKLDALRAEFDKLAADIDAVFAAIVKARAGDGL